jgi:hypothetical protein
LKSSRDLERSASPLKFAVDPTSNGCVGIIPEELFFAQAEAAFRMPLLTQRISSSGKPTNRQDALLLQDWFYKTVRLVTEAAP